MVQVQPKPSGLVTLRNAFISGCILVAPLWVTVWAFSKVVDLVGGTFKPVFFFYLPETLREGPGLQVVWDVLATLLVAVLLTALGYVSRLVFGKYFLGVGERFIQNIPGVAPVYNSVKQIVSTFSQQSKMFSKVLLVEFPRKGSWAVGFLTNTEKGEAQSKTNEDVWTVFIPTSPNPTSGFLLLVPREDIVELDMSVGDGMKMIISGGAVLPPWPPSKAKATAKAN